ncbi:hypothetical protein PHK61_30550 [Actinomycetospora lutea]|uniref:hypothetical protein n=1 Tax=Actinomycetospora lutea TaxID=663604 RepID=UPI0023657BA5|nr:hypothetical protein [Actinomycetospora lutea]MDD7942763.1 hypothetical protein [Actinomycetospora lutea]
MRRLLLAALLVVAAIIWVGINKPVEGDVLLELTRRHGVTTADLLSLIMLAMAAVIAWPSRRRSRPAPDAPRVSSPPRNVPPPEPTRPVPGPPRPPAPPRR